MQRLYVCCYRQDRLLLASNNPGFKWRSNLKMSLNFKMTERQCFDIGFIFIVYCQLNSRLHKFWRIYVNTRTKLWRPHLVTNST